MLIIAYYKMYPYCFYFMGMVWIL